MDPLRMVLLETLEILEALMTCSNIKLGDGTHMIVCRRHSYVPKGERCRWCQKPGTKLCDFPVEAGQSEMGSMTCDARICNQHAKNVGPDKDYCPDHAKEKQ